MNFRSVRLITADIERLVSFYQRITGMPITRYTDDFAELKTSSCTLAIGSTRTLQAFGDGDVARPAANRTAIIEFQVADVDSEYRRLLDIVGEFVQTPTTMPWGNRSILFRDPDQNLVNFFSPVSPEAIAKFD